MVILNWQCHFTEHQFHLWRELEKLPDIELVHVVARLSSSSREKQGWATIDLSKLKGDAVLLGKSWWRQGLRLINDYPKAIHVFGGFWADRRFFPLIMAALLRKRKVAVMQEGYATEAISYLEGAHSVSARFKVWARPVLYRMLAQTVQNLSTRSSFCLLALGKDACIQMEAAGFRREQIFPFGYFVPKQACTVTRMCQEYTLHLIFVGSPLKRKGIDLLLSAMADLDNEGDGVQLDLYGPGDFPGKLPSNVRYKGSIPFGKAQAVIARYDALVLASRHDGWGVVVNEALLQGVPVIISSKVGARCLVEHSGAGLVFESGDKDALVEAIRMLAELKERDEFDALRNRARWISERISPECAAAYLYRILDFQFMGVGDRPKEPWSV